MIRQLFKYWLSVRCT